MIGQVVGGFRVVELLANADTSGMGRLYVAEHIRNGRKAVLKQLRIEGVPEKQKKDLAERFFREARAAARIEDPDIVQVFDSGQHSDGSYYIVMEKLAGESLAKRLEREDHLPPATAIGLTRLIARVLGVVHKNNVIHRDLKPANVFLVNDPTVGIRTKLLDFGIAKMKDATSGITATDGGFGTAPYMAPEQFQKAVNADAPTDVYALGCMLYEMLTGRPPFPGPGLFDFMRQHCTERAPKPSESDKTLAPFDAIVGKMLAKEPKDRFQSAEEVEIALGELSPADDSGAWRRAAGIGRTSGSLGTAATTMSGASGQTNNDTSARKRSPVTWIAGAVLLAGGIVGGVVLLGGPTVTPAPDAAHFTAVVTPDAAPRVPPATQPATKPAVVEKAAVENKWIRVAPANPPVTLGLAAKSADEVGFRADRGIVSPRRAYEIQEHEVTWAEVAKWLAAHPDVKVEAPAASELIRQHFPAVGLPWAAARAYCQGLDPKGELPTEEQWEFAARGPERRRYPWGDAPIDTARTHAWRDGETRLTAVMTSDQDVTPDGIHDLAGNAREWTVDLYRADKRGENEAWVGTGEKSYRAVRGLPLTPPDKKARLPVEGAAYRKPLCTWDCAQNARAQQAGVGFRCVRESE